MWKRQNQNLPSTERDLPMCVLVLKEKKNQYLSVFLPEDCGKTTGGMCLKKKCHKPWACRWSNRWVRGTWCSF